MIPNHWVVLSSAVKINGKVLTDIEARKIKRRWGKDAFDEDFDDSYVAPDQPDTVTLSAYSWGYWNNPVLGRKRGQVKLQYFLSCYYGHIAAKW